MQLLINKQVICTLLMCKGLICNYRFNLQFLKVLLLVYNFWKLMGQIVITKVESVGVLW